jgi:hypothetical protein
VIINHPKLLLCLNYKLLEISIIKVVKEHFKDVAGDNEATLSKSVPRSAVKLVCLHKDTDPITLTVVRLLIWWVEARGLFNEIIYGIPADTFHETVRFQPQIKLFWREYYFFIFPYSPTSLMRVET